ncbi:MAG: DUF4419 domain-containing protein [Bacteroidota bacterium]
MRPLLRIICPLLFISGLNAQKTTQSGLVIHVDTVIPTSVPYNEFPASQILGNPALTVLVGSQLDQKIVPTGQNSFLETVHLAYAQHHDLVLSPDDIWIQIALGVSLHINEHFDALQSRVVKSAEREELVVRMDDLVNLKEENWQQLIDTFALMAQQKTTDDFYSTMLPEFSTSTPETKTVLHTILLSSLKEVISLRGASGCGIPNVILLGTREDWVKLLQHVEQLDKYDLQFWTTELKPILQEFINAFDGKPDRAFWQRMYKYRIEYNKIQMNGWLSKLFPYFTKSEWMRDDRLDAYIESHPEAGEADGVTITHYYRNPYLSGNDYLHNSIEIRDLPDAICEIPLIWNNFYSNDPAEQEQQLTLCAGFIGADQQDLALKPHAAWYITKQLPTADPSLEDFENWDSPSPGRFENDFETRLWSDSIHTGKLVNAIYDPEHCKSTQPGKEALKKELTQHLKKSFPNDELKGTTLKLFISHFGHCASVEIIGGKLSDAARIELELKMKKLNHGFRPTIITTSDEKAFEMWDVEYPVSFPANSVLEVVF